MSFERRGLLLRGAMLLAGLGAALYLGLVEGVWLGALVTTWAGLRGSHLLPILRARRALRSLTSHSDDHFELARPRGHMARALTEVHIPRRALGHMARALTEVHIPRRALATWPAL